MKVISLQSGSNGNCIYVEAGGARLLLDAGISGITAQNRLAQHGIDIHSVDAVLLSHDHSDHARCAGVYHRKFHLPLYATRRTFEAAAGRMVLGKIDEVRHFAAGGVVEIKGLRIETIPTPHDAVEGVAVVVTDGSKRLGILTDLGHAFDGLAAVISTLDAVLLESNYDVAMLRDGPYPLALKQRIAGPGGHLSNEESAQLLLDAAGNGLKWACLAHLSEMNNDPQVAMATHRQFLSQKFPLHMASRYGVSPVMEV